MDYAAPFTIPYNSCGSPALVVPAGRHANGLPIGVQIAAPHYAEHELIHFGRSIERLGVIFANPTGTSGRQLAHTARGVWLVVRTQEIWDHHVQDFIETRCAHHP